MRNWIGVGMPKDLEVSAGFVSIHTMTMLEPSLAGRAPNIPCKPTCSQRPATERLQSHAIRAAVRDADTSFLMALAIAVSSAILAALPVFAAAFVALSVNTQNWQNASVSMEHKTCNRTNASQ